MVYIIIVDESCQFINESIALSTRMLVTNVFTITTTENSAMFTAKLVWVTSFATDPLMTFSGLQNLSNFNIINI